MILLSMEARTMEYIKLLEARQTVLEIRQKLMSGNLVSLEKYLTTSKLLENLNFALQTKERIKASI